MNENEVKALLKNNFNLEENDLNNIKIYIDLLLECNARYNLVSKKTENIIWSRHVLDSVQLLDYFNINLEGSLVDFGSGAGFPGLVLAICNKNPKFHVKLFEKSPVKREFLNSVKDRIKINVEIADNVYDGQINADIVVARAFKKIEKIIEISREIVKKPHKIIILKGKNAQNEINNVSLASNYSYKMEKSITDTDSKIIVIEVK